MFKIRYLVIYICTFWFSVRRRRGRQTVPKHLHKVNDGLCPHCGEVSLILHIYLIPTYLDSHQSKTDLDV